MFLSVACSALTFLAPQNQDPPPLLTPEETKSLHDKMRVMIAAFLKCDEANETNRAKTAVVYEKDKLAVEKEWNLRCEKKGDLLKSVSDLCQIFDNVFEYERKSGTDSLRKADTPKDFPPYYLFVPRSYKNDVPMRAVVLVPGF